MLKWNYKKIRFEEIGDSNKIIYLVSRMTYNSLVPFICGYFMATEPELIYKLFWALLFIIVIAVPVELEPADEQEALRIEIPKGKYEK